MQQEIKRAQAVQQVNTLMPTGCVKVNFFIKQTSNYYHDLACPGNGVCSCTTQYYYDAVTNGCQSQYWFHDILELTITKFRLRFKL